MRMSGGLVGAATLVLVGACSGTATPSGSPSVPPTAPALSASPSGPTDSPWSAEQQGVLDAGLGFLNTKLDILRGAAPDVSTLSKFATSALAQRTAWKLGSQALSGISASGTIRYVPVTISVTGASARLVLCAEPRGITYYVAGPPPTTAAPSPPTTTVLLLTKTAARWLVSEQGDRNQGAGVPCTVT